MQYNDMEQGQLRFYQLILQRDLLGGWFLISESGVQGKPGRLSKRQFEDFDQAQAAMEQSRDRQLRKGFKVVFVKALGPESG